MNENKKTFKTNHEIEQKELRFFIQGEIDHHSAKQLREEIDELIFDNRPDILYMDFSNVEFMDSSGLGLIMGRFKLMQVYGGKTILLNPAHRILKIIELSGMNRIIEIKYSDEKLQEEASNE